jgi:hypothetical protein
VQVVLINWSESTSIEFECTSFLFQMGGMVLE